MILAIAKWILIMVALAFVVTVAVVVIGIVAAIIRWIRERRRHGE